MSVAARRAIVVSPLIPYPTVGGGHKRTMRLIEAIERAGAHPHLLSADADGAAGAEALRARGWTVESLPAPSGSLGTRARQHWRRQPGPRVPGIAERLRALSAGRPAFVQLEHTLSACYLEDAGAPTVLSLHNVDSRVMAMLARAERPLSPAWARAWGRWQAMRASERRGAAAADALLCVSPADVEHFSGLGAPVLVPNGVDDELFDIAVEPPGGEDVLFFGQFGYAPNAHGVLRFLKDGWPHLAAARPAARLRLVGRHLGGELARVAAASERVDAVGFVEDITTELARARVVIVPLWQGGGTRLKVLEALAAGRPVVGTPLGVAQIGFEAGRHGRLGRTPSELADATAALLADAAAARAMGSAGRSLAGRFRWREVTRPAEELYARWLEPSTGPTPS
ncbi:MAG TPA: glycosyltransferase [Solirubrobacteraceae bacterium]|nr:glycosyltransferase [Solirubrobacteraceae bacterium]